MGTSTPSADLDVQTTGNNAKFVLARSDGAAALMAAANSIVSVGSTNNFPLQLIANNSWRAKLFGDNSLTMKSGATCTTGGVWTDNAALESQENVRQLSKKEALEALGGLQPVHFNYKANPGQQHLGFTAENSRTCS